MSDPSKPTVPRPVIRPDPTRARLDSFRKTETVPVPVPVPVLAPSTVAASSLASSQAAPAPRAGRFAPNIPARRSSTSSSSSDASSSSSSSLTTLVVFPATSHCTLCPPSSHNSTTTPKHSKISSSYLEESRNGVSDTDNVNNNHPVPPSPAPPSRLACSLAVFSSFVRSKGASVDSSCVQRGFTDFELKGQEVVALTRELFGVEEMWSE
eukprot:GILI01049771.1.p1 GENE.GILI01049771.1~~GILI01049771.1.p1  ORF type:complete len:210 (+),score=31.28 GILI01049771.1:129-758(+)